MGALGGLGACLGERDDEPFKVPPGHPDGTPAAVAGFHGRGVVGWGTKLARGSARRRPRRCADLGD